MPLLVHHAAARTASFYSKASGTPGTGIQTEQQRHASPVPPSTYMHHASTFPPMQAIQWRAPHESCEFCPLVARTGGPQQSQHATRSHPAPPSATPRAPQDLAPGTSYIYSYMSTCARGPCFLMPLRFSNATTAPPASACSSVLCQLSPCRSRSAYNLTGGLWPASQLPLAQLPEATPLGADCPLMATAAPYTSFLHERHCVQHARASQVGAHPHSCFSIRAQPQPSWTRMHAPGHRPSRRCGLTATADAVRRPCR